MSVPIKYHCMNVLRRWKTALGAWLNIALVVAVYVMMQALATGLNSIAQKTGDANNVIGLRKGSLSESASTLTQEQVNALRYDSAIARDDQDQPIFSPEIVSVVNLPRLANQGEANVPFRGLKNIGISLRSQVSLTEGRWFDAGKMEIVTSTRMASRFQNMQIGNRLRMGAYELTVVGHFEAGSTAFASEVWMDLDDSRRVFSLDGFSSVLFRTRDVSQLSPLIERMDKDQRIRMRLLSELSYYNEQTKTVGPIRFLGYFLAVIMSIGAIFSAMNTMYANISNRTRELGTLRAMGFSRGVIFTGLVLEGALIGILGGCVGSLLSLPLQDVQTGTMAFDTFTEIIFNFNITPELMLQGVGFGFVIGVLGSVLPAFRVVKTSMIMSLKGA